ncbi:hypothetical protein HDF26_002123 [Pedobacter cryoconitis]|uniref:hypothetical protein n=1 Tax=Pedobacter cryoconitis TaxID=188932 RepID=UPI0016219740|nr:hypothetical protein [Pedobacter cryoconitis]MBB6271666.1 hypothetical protein [Pedobacter cryoconitis]
MEHLPLYIKPIFILSTLLTILLLYKATRYSKPIIIVIVLWLVIQSILSLSGFYTVTSGIPPRFAILLFPPVILIALCFFTSKGKTAMDRSDVKILTLLHTVRIPVELGLYALYLHHAVPEIMTFEGRNFDILCGLTAPFVYYFGYIRNVLSRNILIVWNMVCLLLLANIVLTAVLSAPFAFQQFAFDQPNIALAYFPFAWLPCCIVPIVLFAHLVSLRRLFIASVKP